MSHRQRHKKNHLFFEAINKEHFLMCAFFLPLLFICDVNFISIKTNKYKSMALTLLVINFV